MAKLAIMGHATRGKEVIEILKMLGGKERDIYHGDVKKCWVYTINEEGFIDWEFPCDRYAVYSLEDYLEKYPYKIGDKVSSKYLKNYKIGKMEWEDTNNRVIYKLQGMGWYSADELQPYKEETMEKTIKTITIEDFLSNSKEWLIDTLESMSKDDALQTICDLHDELQKHPSKEDIKDSIAKNAASTWCRCFKCDKIIRDTNAKCDKDKLITCHQWYDGYRTALLALGDERCQEVYK